MYDGPLSSCRAATCYLLAWRARCIQEFWKQKSRKMHTRGSNCYKPSMSHKIDRLDLGSVFVRSAKSTRSKSDAHITWSNTRKLNTRLRLVASHLLPVGLNVLRYLAHPLQRCPSRLWTLRTSLSLPGFSPRLFIAMKAQHCHPSSTNG